ncbi:MAG: ABC transporter ATP-binding protein, partial [Desulfobacterales bacterium]|nr:ABC transporter ATP-binding protein [Desulfobacterales bacterium]
IRFQRKCFREFERFKREGKTILFVTHAVELIRSYCDSAIFLHKGEIRRQGEPRDVVHDYLDMLFGTEDGSSGAEGKLVQPLEPVSAATSPTGDHQKQIGHELNSDFRLDGARLRKSYNASEYRWGEQQARIIDYLLESGGVADPVVLQQEEKIKLTMRVYFHQALDDLIYGITIKTLDGTTVYGANTRERGIRLASRKKGEMADISFTLKNNLVQGSYFVS